MESALIVLYDFRYTSKDNREISVKKGEKLYLIEKTNKDWWQVVRNGEMRSFYVPAQYVEPSNVNSQIDNKKPSRNHPDQVAYENLNSLLLKDEPSQKPDNLKNKTSQDGVKQKPVPKTRTKVSGRKNSYENPDVKTNKSECKSGLSQTIDNDKNDKRYDKYKYEDKINQDLSFSLPKNSEQLSEAYDNAVYCNVPSSNKGKISSGLKSNKTNLEFGKNRMRNSYNLKVKPSKSFDYHQVSASNFERKQSVPLMRNEKLKLSKALSKSLEKLAEEIKFEPSSKSQQDKTTTGDRYSRTKPLKAKENMDKKGRTNDASVVLDENKVQAKSSIFNRFKRPLHINSSFKSKNQKKLGKSSKQVCELSLSWEGGLDKIDEREEKPQVTSTGLQRSQTFMVADRLSSNNKTFSIKNRLDVAYHTPKEEKLTLETFKPKIQAQIAAKEVNSKNAYENVSVASAATPTGPDGKNLSKSNLMFYNETYSNSESEDNLEEKSIVEAKEESVDKSLKSQLSINSNVTSEGTGLSESDDNDLDKPNLESSRQGLNKKRTSIVRSRRVETSKDRTVTARRPPTPSFEEGPMKELNDGWGLYYAKDGRSYYYNVNTGEKNWKPPRKKVGEAKQLDGSRESVCSDVSSSLTRSNTSSPSNDRCHLSNPSLNRSNASLNSRSTYFENSSFDRSKSGSVYHSKEESPDDLNRSSRSSSYSLNKSGDSLNRFSPVENIPSEEEGYELNDHVYHQDDANKNRHKIKTFDSKRKSEESLKGSECVINEKKEEEEEEADKVTSEIVIPEGWQERFDEKSRTTYYVHSRSQQKWYSSHDSEGKVYFYRENSNESSWDLPDLTCEERRQEFNYGIQRSATESAITKTKESYPKLRHSKNGNDGYRVSSSTRSSKTRSMVYEPSFDVSTNLSKSGEILKDYLNKTKIAENGKKLRKHWTKSFVVLSESCLLFFKDEATYRNMKPLPGYNANQMCLNLKGAEIEKGNNISSRKNVYKISCLDSNEILIQDVDADKVERWFESISSVIEKLGQEPVNTSSSSLDPNSPSKVGRSKSLKAKGKDSGSMEGLNASAEERQNKMKFLRKFFNRRPTIESLKKKGIYKDEPVFGSTLEQLTKNRKPRIPGFVQRCIEIIEKEENMKADGLYRASGNLSQIQKIRLDVDQNNLRTMEEEEDVHVLTGSLKLFFRELKEPLIPFKQLKMALDACTSLSRKERIKDFQKIVKSLPEPNYDILRFLLQHLQKVIKYQEYNRMNINNLAIVFGPTLMRPEHESKDNMASDLMHQSRVVEYLLGDFDEIFT